MNPVSVSWFGAGTSKPVAKNKKPDGSDDPVGRQKNRRIDIIVSTIQASKR